MPSYITLEDVRLRLANKVRFQDPNAQPEDNENKMPIALANRLLDEAEGQVEQDLSPRYMAPFQHSLTGNYIDLPARPTKNVIRTLCELMAVIRILETDFGTGTVADASKYSGNLEKRYRKIIDETILFKPEGMEATKQFYYPPLPNLKLNYFNKAADDGFVGGVLHHSNMNDQGDYATNQINEPGEDFFNAKFDE
jgi:hypothetical protein